jgi:hypothetical protein
MSWDLFLKFIFVLAISTCSCMPFIEVLEAHAHMWYFWFCFDLSTCIFVKNIYSFAMWVTVLANCSSARAVCGDQSFPLYTHIPFCEYFFITCTLIKYIFYYIFLNLYRII